MEFHIGIEDMEPGSWIAWVFEIPGCYARGSTREEAIDRVPEAVSETLDRLKQRGFPVDDFRSPFSASIAEEFRAFNSSPDYEVNAFFDNDRIPLTDSDMGYARNILSVNRDELLAVISSLPESHLDREIPGEVQKNIRGILKHIGTAEWWYWDRLGKAFPRDEWPDNELELLNIIREFTLQNLTDLVGDSQTTVRSGEEWSPRKLVRRAIWHERAHTLQIRRYMESSLSV